jgi:hypothetical protein
MNFPEGAITIDSKLVPSTAKGDPTAVGMPVVALMLKIVTSPGCDTYPNFPEGAITTANAPDRDKKGEPGMAVSTPVVALIV